LLIQDVLEFIGTGTPAANPVAGSFYLYYKSDGLLYKKDSLGIETALNTGGGESSLTPGNIILKSSSEAQSVSSVTTYTTKLTAVTPVLVAGEYKVSCSWQIQHSMANRNMLTRVRLDATTDIIFDNTRQADAAGEYVQKSGFWYGNLTALAHTFTVDFAPAASGAQMRIRNVYLIIERLT
jgi:hypothetical protein